MEDVKVINVDTEKENDWLVKINMDKVNKLGDREFKKMLVELINFKYPKHTEFVLHKNCQTNQTHMEIDY